MKNKNEEQKYCSLAWEFNPRAPLAIDPIFIWIIRFFFVLKPYNITHQLLGPIRNAFYFIYKIHIIYH